MAAAFESMSALVVKMIIELHFPKRKAIFNVKTTISKCYPSVKLYHSLSIDKYC